MSDNSLSYRNISSDEQIRNKNQEEMIQCHL